MGNIFDVEARESRHTGPWCDDCVCEHIEWNHTNGRIKRTLIDNLPPNHPRVDFFVQMQRDTLTSPPLPSTIADGAIAPVVWRHGLRVDIGDHARIYVDDATDDVYLWRRPSHDVPIPLAIRPDIVPIVKGILDRGEECGICRVRRGAPVRLPGCKHAMCAKCLLLLIDDAESDHVICPFCRRSVLLTSLVPVHRLRDGCDSPGLTDTELRVMGLDPVIPADVTDLARKLVRSAKRLDLIAPLFPFVPNAPESADGMSMMAAAVDEILSMLTDTHARLLRLGSIDEPITARIHAAMVRTEAYQQRIRDSPARTTPLSIQILLQTMFRSVYAYIESMQFEMENGNDLETLLQTRDDVFTGLSVASEILRDPWGNGWIDAIHRARRAVEDLSANAYTSESESEGSDQRRPPMRRQREEESEHPPPSSRRRRDNAAT